MNTLRYLHTALTPTLSILAVALSMGCGPEPTPTSESVDPINDQAEFDQVSVPLSCEGVSREDNCIEPMKNALRLDAEDRLGFEKVTFDRESMSILMRMKPGAKLPGRIKVGAPIYRARKDRKPFMAIVEAIDRDGDEVRIQVRQAKLEEIFRRGRIKTRIPLEIDPEEAMQQALEMGPTAEAEDMQRRLQGLTDLFSIGCKRTLVDERIAGTSYKRNGSKLATVNQFADIDVELSQCEVVLKGELYADMDWGGAFGTPSKFEFSIGAGFEVTLEMSAAITLDKDNAFEYFAGIYDTQLFPLPSLDITVGGIPLKLKPSLHGGVIIDANTDITASAGFNYDAQTTLGFVWNAGNGVNNLSESSSSFTNIGPEFSQAGDATVQVYVRPEIELTIAGALSGNFAIQTYVEVNSAGTGEFNEDGEFDGKVCYDLDAGFNPIVGLDVLGIIDKSWKLKGKNYNLSEGCLESDTVVAVPSCGPSDECVIDSDCSSQETTACTVYKCTSNCTCKTIEKPACCVSHADCNDSDPSTLDTCEMNFGTCLNNPIAGYCDSNNECNDGQIQTEDTCVDNRCTFKNVKSTEDLIAPGAVCFTHADCNDNNPTTTDSCEAGDCVNRGTIAENSRCFDDSECDDGVIFTIDTCNAVGDCTHDSNPTFQTRVR